MTMFWTAFIWGLGATLGGSVGLMAFVVMNTGWNRLANSSAAKTMSEVNQLSLAALEKRNELTEEQLEFLERITVMMERDR